MSQKDYPLHPGQTMPQPYYCTIPLEEYESLKKAHRWRKVSEEKPPEGVDVLIYDGDAIYLAYMEFMADSQIWFWPPNSPHVEGVTHWMPLPEPPEET